MRPILTLLLIAFTLVWHPANAQPTQFDSSFDGDGELGNALPSPPAPVEAGIFNRIAVDDQTRTVIGGYNFGVSDTTLLVGRLLVDGVRDPNFGSAGVVALQLGLGSSPSDIKAMPDGSIYVCGTMHPGINQLDGFVLRLQPDGTFDTDASSSDGSSTARIRR